VVITGLVTLRAVRSREAPAEPDHAAFEALRTAPLDPAAPAADAGVARAPAGAQGAVGGQDAAPAAFFQDEGLDPAARAALAIVAETERGHASGSWSVARKRFEPCPGEDLERLAWIDVWSRIVKLTGTRAEAVVVEQWFDREGRLRGVRAVRPGAGAWSVNALLDERGGTVRRAASGAAPPLEELRLTMKNPSSAFFEKPRCEPGKQ
jgi:hypothetical protein